MKTVDFIAGIPLFQGLPREQLEALARIVITRPFKKGTVIFREGEEGSGFYVLTRGEVKIFKLSPEGREQILHIFRPGEPFGEVPVFSGENYPAFAETLSASEAIFFPRADFLALLSRTPSLALNMLAILSRRLRNFSHLIEDLSLKEVPGRLAAYLIYSGKARETLLVEIPMTKNQLASLLGTIPETLSRILTKLSREGLIRQLNHRQIAILDYQGLEELAQGERRLA
ncbi:MAG: Crp/Fnr family transcriptional regulator [Smithellaceae bacterium]|nr:Crp/Fnr family transcriptional regulator [Smithellaceae bacterium]